MRFKKLIYKNFFGEYNILITITDDGKTPHRDTLIPDREIFGFFGNNSIGINPKLYFSIQSAPDFIFIFLIYSIASIYDR